MLSSIVTENVDVWNRLLMNQDNAILRINAVQDYTENHLDEEINIRKLSKIASFSEYNFQRIFKRIYLKKHTSLSIKCFNIPEKHANPNWGIS